MDEHTVESDEEASSKAAVVKAEAHSTAPAANEREPKRESLPTQDADLNIKWTPPETLIDSQLAGLLNGPPGLSQDPCLFSTQHTQEIGSLQQEMERIQRISPDKEQARAQEAAAALRGGAASPSAAVVPDLQPGHAAHDTVQGALVDIKPTVGGDAAAVAARAASGSDELLQLAAAAAMEQQEDQAAGYRDQNMQQYDPSTLAAMQQQYADPSWAAAYAGMPMGMMNMNYYYMPGQYTQQKHPSLTKPEHQGSTAKRRGPMDEMRQLQRILTKLLPGSIIYMPNQDGGGNKVQADDIKVYLAATLGEAPKPDWGLKNGWGQYLADLFNWATGREGDAKITNLDAMDCARRPQGRSWEVVFDKLMELGIYSWNWELPLRQEQVLNCQKSPPPELTRQQEALAAATAAAAAAAAVTAGTTPDAIPNLPVVARMASLLGNNKRQHHQMGPMHGMGAMPMVPPGMMYGAAAAAAGGGGAPYEAGSVMGGSETGSGMPSGAVAAAAAAAGGGGGEAGAEAAGADERPAKQQRSSSAGPSATDAPGNLGNGGAAAAAAAAGGNASAAAGGAGAVPGGGAAGSVLPMGDAAGQQVLQAPEEATNVQQLLTFYDNISSRTLGVMQTMVLSGNAQCPSMEYISYVKNFKLDPVYASLMSLVVQAGTQQAAMLQHMQQQATLQEAKNKVRAEAAASSRAAAADPAAAAAAPVPLPAAYAAASSASAHTTPPAAAAAAAAAAASAGTVSDAQGERDSSAALAAAAAAAGAAAAAAAMAPAAAAAGSKHSNPTAAMAAKALKKQKGGRASREAQQSGLAQLAQQQSAVQAAAAEASWAAAAATQQRGQQEQASFRLNAAIRAGYGVAAADTSIVNSEEALKAAALALTTLHNSSEVLEEADGGQQQQYEPVGGNRQHAAQEAAAAAALHNAALQKRRVGSSRLANGSSRALNNSPSKAH